MPSRRIVVSWIACCVVLGSLAARVSYGQTAQSPSKPKAQTSKLVEECNAKTKSLAALSQQPEYHTANNAVERIYQSADPFLVELEKLKAGNGAPDAGTAQTDAKKAATVDEQLDALPDKTLETALDFFNIQIDQVDACLSAAFGNRQINVAEHLADNLDTAWSRESDLRSALNAHYQKAYDDKALVSPEDLQGDLQGCQQWQQQLKTTMSTLWITAEQASDKKRWDGLDAKQHSNLTSFYNAETGVGLWCGTAAVEGDTGDRAGALAYFMQAGKYAALGNDHLVRRYNDVVNDYHAILQAYNADEAYIKAAQDLIASDRKLIDIDNRLLSLPSQQPIIFAPPPFYSAPPEPEPLRCVTQVYGTTAYTNCY